MMAKCLVNVVFLALLSTHAVDAFTKTNMRGSQELQTADVDAGISMKKFTINWGNVGIGAAVGGLIGAGVVAGMMFAGKKGDDEEDKEGDEKAQPLVAETEAAADQTDYVELLKNLSKKVADDVGPKFEKGGAVRNVLESRVESFTDKAKNFLLNEMNGAAGAVMREMEAEESMLMLDWNNAVESNFPPASILIAGVLSPTIINLLASHHFIQCLTVGLPLFCLCVFATIVDWNSVCSIPTIYVWLYTQLVLSFLLFVGHGILFSKLASGRKTLQAKQDEVHENLEGMEDGGFANVKEQFIGNTIILQEALMIENGVRHSMWNSVVGIATVCWLLTTIWNLVLICGWTFVPGIVAFHPKAAEVAKTDFCGAWATVLVLRISMLLSVLYLFLNLATVVQWLCDVLVSSSAFTNGVLKQARKMDKDAGVPIVEMLAKAFLLRGGDETIISKLAVVQYHKKSLKNKEAKLAGKLAGLQSSLRSIEGQEAKLTDQAKDGGDLAAQVHKLNSSSVDYDLWKKQGKDAIEAAELRVGEIGAASTDALDKLYEKINEIMEEVKNSEAVQAAAAKAAEAQAAAEALAQQAYDKLNDPEFQAQLREMAEKAKGQVEALGAQAKDMADQAVAMATDPELQKQLQEAAQQAMDQAKAMAEKAAEAANDPELQKKLQEAMEQAQAKAMEAAATVTDPELQKKMQENAMQALEQVQEGAKSAAAAYIDPEVLQQMQDKAMQAVEEAQRAAAQAAAAATDPKIREAALAKLQEAQKQAEAAAAACTDPETRKKFEEQAKKAMEQAQEVGAAAAAAAQESAAAAQESAAAAADQASAAASAAAQDAADKATEVAEQAKEAAKDVAAKAKGTKKSPRKKGN